MNNGFLTSFSLALTPLSPIHIGMGEELDPTGYVIDDGILYAFDPSRAQLSEEVRKQLLKEVDFGRPESIHRVYKLLKDNKETFIPVAHSFIPVGRGVEDKYRESIGKPVQTEGDLKRVFNNNFIERAVYLPADGRPYLPGSSVKGAVRTAWAEALLGSPPRYRPRVEPNRDARIGEALSLEKKLFHHDDGKFETSLLRLLKMSDFIPQNTEIDRKIVFACNVRKTVNSERGQSGGRGPSTRKEVICSGQYRAFLSQAVIQNLGDMARIHPSLTPSAALSPDMARLAKYSNDFHLGRLARECAILRKNGYVNQDWLNRFQRLIERLTPRLEDRERPAFLIRVGRYGDAETKTLKEIAHIKIMGGKGKPPRYQKNSTTLWLAADEDKQEHDLLPFGWALVEVNPKGDNDVLRQWCEEERKDGRRDMREVRAKAKANLESIAAAREAERAEVAGREAARQQAAEEEARQQAARAAMSAEQRKVEEFYEKLKDHFKLKPRDVGVDIVRQGEALLREAAAWAKEEQKSAAEKLEPLFREKGLFDVGGGKGKMFKDGFSRMKS
ncbi:MAG: type III-A CRISPR-associated RAMP protein Csm5 [Methylobacteriaceae bacterium]|jgi:CRISPR-associated protein Csm5|nr:type III-A CRISPR-associated RAMP protein Csm5 [Methylobacteriaceae bacterium]